MRLIYAALLLCAYAFASDSAVSFVSIVDHLKGATVPIVCVGQNPDGTAFLIPVEGTGFFLSDDGDIVTAGHVAQGLFAPGRIPACPIPAIYIPIGGWDETAASVDLRVSFINRCWWSDTDIGVCNLKENPFTITAITKKPIIAVLEGSLQQEGSVVAFSGFPLTFLQPITSQGIVGAYQGVEPKVGPKVMVLDKNAWPGASGSPVYNINGKIVGMVVQRGFNDATGLAFARTSAFIERFLAENRKARQEEDKKQEVPKP
jgi:S1-C subfamily serine protease